MIVPTSDHLIPLAIALAHSCAFLAHTHEFLHTCMLYDHELRYVEYPGMIHPAEVLGSPYCFA